jgi:hypothetical protein
MFGAGIEAFLDFRTEPMKKVAQTKDKSHQLETIRSPGPAGPPENAFRMQPFDSCRRAALGRILAL